MSYILDALRKIEKDEGRAGDSGNRLSGGYRPPGRPPRRKWRYFLAATAVAVVVVIVVLRWGGADDLPVDAARPSLAEEVNEKKDQNPPAAAATVVDHGIPTELQASEAVRAVPALPAERESVEKSPAPPPVAEEVSFEDVFGDIAVGDGPEPSVDVIAEEGGDVAGTGETPRENGGAMGGAPGTNAPDAGRLYYFEDLPEDLKVDIGELDITGHIYSEDANFRLLMVGDGVRREGETISPGLVLKEITAEGAHFTYRGFLFLVDPF